MPLAGCEVVNALDAIPVSLAQHPSHRPGPLPITWQGSDRRRAVARPHHRQRVPLVALAMKGPARLGTPIVGLLRGSLAERADG